jgi:hypothetical protein
LGKRSSHNYGIFGYGHGSVHQYGICTHFHCLSGMRRRTDTSINHDGHRTLLDYDMEKLS